MLYCGCMKDGRVWEYGQENSKAKEQTVCGGARRLYCTGEELYAVSLRNSRMVRISDGASVAIGKYPTGLFVKDGRAWIACGESNNVWVVDTKVMRPVEAYDCGSFPLDLCGSEDRFAVACMGTCEVFLFHVDGRVLQRIQTDCVPYTAAPCGEGVLYAGVSERGSKAVYTDSRASYAIPLGGCMPGEIRPYGKERAVVTDCACGTVAYLDLKSRTVLQKLQGIGMPDDICILPNGIAVSCMEDDCILLTDFDGCRARCLHTGDEPRGLAYSSEESSSV